MIEWSSAVKGFKKLVNRSGRDFDRFSRRQVLVRRPPPGWGWRD